MPELPEVETIKNELLPYIKGRRIDSAVIRDAKVVQKLPLEDFCSKLVGKRITDLTRRGKYLIFRLSGGQVLIIHLRMTGALFFNPEGLDKYARAIFYLDDGSRLVFSDRRRLGVIYLVDDEKEVTGSLGIEPFDGRFTWNVLAERLAGRQAPVKAVLLDQSLLAGVGNMYADEALYSAKIHPLKKAGDLSEEDVKRLHKSLFFVLKKAIDNKGASVDTYKRPDGDIGTAHNHFKVAHQRGRKCEVCGSLIERVAVRNRGSYFCPGCQKL